MEVNKVFYTIVNVRVADVGTVVVRDISLEDLMVVIFVYTVACSIAGIVIYNIVSLTGSGKIWGGYLYRVSDLGRGSILVRKG